MSLLFMVLVFLLPLDTYSYCHKYSLQDLTFVGLLDDVNATRLDPVTGGVATLVGETGLILTSVLTFDSLIRELNETEVVCTDSDGDNNRTRIIMAGWS